MPPVLTLGPATSSAPAMFRPPSEWAKVHGWLVGDVVQPAELGKEMPEVVGEQAAVAGACETSGAKAEVVDYFPSYNVATGLGFAQWRVLE